MDIIIRDARIEDAPFLAQAEREIAKTPGFLVSAPTELLDERFRTTIEKLSHHTDGKYLVAEYESKIVGHALLDPLPLAAISHVASLTIVVHEGWQGKGIGRLLLQHLIDWAKTSSSVEKIELSVRASNTRAIALYKKMGFTEEGHLKKRIKVSANEYIDDILMALFVK